jgi:hypothetical protein
LNGSQGGRCPEFEFRPRTIEGDEVCAILARSGVWQRYGESGERCGLDLVEAMASLPNECDRDRSRRFFIIAERAYLTALIKHKRS